MLQATLLPGLLLLLLLSSSSNHASSTALLRVDAVANNGTSCMSPVHKAGASNAAPLIRLSAFLP
jgi:hypothetical protein